LKAIVCYATVILAWVVPSLGPGKLKMARFPRDDERRMLSFFVLLL